MTTEISIPWAKDAEGKDVETWFTTDGQSLTQHVKHDVEGIVYPVTADPVFIPWWIAYTAFKMAVPVQFVIKYCTRHSHAPIECSNHLRNALQWRSHWYRYLDQF